MPSAKLTASEKAQIEVLVKHYQAHHEFFVRGLAQLRELLNGSSALLAHVHSIKWRVKDSSHLRGKLKRRLVDNKKKGKGLGISETNLFKKINDLAGIRILHLHTR